MTAYIIVDLGFGDAGKGLLTDYLCRRLETDLVVRYNGGAQAGHNVVTPDGRHHTFSQFSSGTFLPHVKTFLSKHVVIHPTALLVEGEMLAQKGVFDPFARLRISENALVITPFHQAVNRIRELARGDARHGSCGIGIGETVADSMEYAENSIRAGDFTNTDLLRSKLRAIQERKGRQVNEICKANAHDPAFINECTLFEVSGIVDIWIEAIERINKLGMVTPDTLLADRMRKTPNVIFEGAQGVLLDEDIGFYPYVTRSTTTTQNATEILNAFASEMPIQKIGVLRSYTVRHGAGPLPTETTELNEFLSEHNTHNPWQGIPRYGWFDSILARLALSATGGVDTLAITHMDVLPHLQRWIYANGYQNLIMTMPSRKTSLQKRARFTTRLSQAVPILKSCVAEDKVVIEKIEELLGRKTGFLSYGPRAEDVQESNSFLG